MTVIPASPGDCDFRATVGSPPSDVETGFSARTQAAARGAHVPAPPIGDQPTHPICRRPISGRPADVDRLWLAVRSEALAIARSDCAMTRFVTSTVLDHNRLEDAIGFRVAQRLATPHVDAEAIADAFRKAFADDPLIGASVRADLAAVLERDPACDRYVEPLLYFKGFHAIQAYRLAHWLWQSGRRDFALWLQSRASEVFQTDINPAARIGKGIFLDHATGLVVGSTAMVGDDVSILHEVTLGGTGKDSGDRHPKIKRGVLIGAGAKILGNIIVGACARVAAGSVVLRPVPANTTVAGVPARIVGGAGPAVPAHAMDHMLAERGLPAYD